MEQQPMNQNLIAALQRRGLDPNLANNITKQSQGPLAQVMNQQQAQAQPAPGQAPQGMPGQVPATPQEAPQPLQSPLGSPLGMSGDEASVISQALAGRLQQLTGQSQQQPPQVGMGE